MSVKEILEIKVKGFIQRYIINLDLNVREAEERTRIEKEKQTINLMINLYCKKKHKQKNILPFYASLW